MGPKPIPPIWTVYMCLLHPTIVLIVFQPYPSNMENLDTTKVRDDSNATTLKPIGSSAIFIEPYGDHSMFCKFTGLMSKPIFIAILQLKCTIQAIFAISKP